MPSIVPVCVATSVQKKLRARTCLRKCLEGKFECWLGVLAEVSFTGAAVEIGLRLPLVDLDVAACVSQQMKSEHNSPQHVCPVSYI
jgi:hypothetical protein